MPDTFATFTPSLESPARHVYTVTPDDATDIDHPSRALNVAGAGTIRVTTLGGEDTTVYVAAGCAFPVRVSRIWATGTTATGITVMY